MANLPAASAISPQPASPAPATPAHAGGLFHELLRDCNLLQYIPVVGTIYRAITADQGNPTLRFAASLGTSFALGGPIGVAITVGEKAAGIDPERMVLNAARHLFHLGHDETPHVAAAAAPDPGAHDSPGSAFAIASSDVTADTLNGLELQRLNG